MSTTKQRKVYRKHGHDLSKISLHLSASDHQGLRKARDAYASGLGLNLSSSLLVSLSISALAAETARGYLRQSPELYAAGRGM